MVRHVERCTPPPRIAKLRPSMSIAPTTYFPFLAAHHFRVDRLPESSLFAFPVVGVRNDIRKGNMPIVLGRSRKTASSLLRLGIQRDVLPAVRASGGGLNPHDPRCYRMSQLKNGRWIALSRAAHENARPSALLQSPCWYQRHKQTEAGWECRVPADRQKLVVGDP